MPNPAKRVPLIDHMRVRADLAFLRLAANLCQVEQVIVKVITSHIKPRRAAVVLEQPPEHVESLKDWA